VEAMRHRRVFAATNVSIAQGDGGAMACGCMSERGGTTRVAITLRHCGARRKTEKKGLTQNCLRQKGNGAATVFCLSSFYIYTLCHGKEKGGEKRRHGPLGSNHSSYHSLSARGNALLRRMGGGEGGAANDQSWQTPRR